MIKQVSNIRIFIMIALCLSVVACTSVQYKKLTSQNSSFRVKSIVMHFTAVDYARSVELLVDEGYVSAHYLIPQSNDPSYPNDSLEIIQLVDDDQRAWHAGVSYWQGRTGLNDTSIGIEIVNIPECIETEEPSRPALHSNDKLCVYPDFDPKQIELLIRLGKDLLARHPDVSPTSVVGHSDIAPSRKHDPGPRFPWFKLYEAGIGAWYDNDTMAKYWQTFSKHPLDIHLLQRALRNYGYGIIETGIADQQTVDTIAAFQMHFLPWKVTGSADEGTAAAVFALLEKYFPNKLEPIMAQYETTRKNQEPTKAHAQTRGQIDTTFPLINSVSRPYTNDKLSFVSYKGKGQLNIYPQDAESADIYVNGEKLNITLPFVDENYTYSLKRRTKNGVNTLSVRNIKPEGSTIEVVIPFPSLATNNQSKYDFSSVDKLIQDDIDKGFPGASLAIIKGGQIVKLSAYGYAERYNKNGHLLEQASQMTTDTIFDLASNTKVFATTLALMKLVEEKKVKLNAPVYQYLPEYVGGGRRAHSVRHLLSHATGNRAFVQFYKKDKALGEAFFSHNKSYTTELLLSALPTTFIDDALQQYSDLNFMILGLLVERVTGMPLDEYVDAEIYTPLQLKNTVFNPLLKGFKPEAFASTEISGNTRGNRVRFKNIRDYPLRGEVHDENAFYSMQGVAGHAGLFSTVKDLAVLSQLMLNGGGYKGVKLFSEDTIARFTSPSFTKSNLGLGWQLNTNKDKYWHFGAYASASAFGHTGWTGTAVVIDPSLDLAIVLLTNKKHSPIEGNETHYAFTGDNFATGKYGDVMTLIYEAILHGRH
ncbi:penicillin binding protein PBP4B [Agaribacter flavus]|uniref:Penicillin binding protein PBP4B n=1 Tax=Agaribacter flavus TaxID=1902781 RepID=A0ABV7FU29_9ALTE